MCDIVAAEVEWVAGKELLDLYRESGGEGLVNVLFEAILSRKLDGGDWQLVPG